MYAVYILQTQARCVWSTCW